MRLLPFLPFRGIWVARIVEFEWNRQFRDLQIRGPFKKWDHRHIFESAEQSGKAGTILRDVVEYDVGWGAIGGLANRLFVEGQIRAMFAFRQQAATRFLLG